MRCNFSVPGPILNQLVTMVAKWIIHTKYQACMPNGFRQKYIVVFITLAYEKHMITRVVGNLNRKKMHIFGFVGIFEYICKTTFNIIFSMCTKP